MLEHQYPILVDNLRVKLRKFHLNNSDCNYIMRIIQVLEMPFYFATRDSLMRNGYFSQSVTLFAFLDMVRISKCIILVACESDCNTILLSLQYLGETYCISIRACEREFVYHFGVKHMRSEFLHC